MEKTSVGRVVQNADSHYTKLAYFFEGIATSLFHQNGSWSSPVVMLLRELASPASLPDVHIIQIQKDELSSETLRFYNPFCKLPVLVLENGKAVTEMGAIVNYLLHLYDKEYALQPDPSKDIKAYLEYQELFHFTLSTVRPLVSISIVERSAVDPDGEGEDYLQDIQNSINEWNDLVGPKLEDYLARSDGQWMLGKTITPVDMMLTFPLVQAMEFGLLKDFPTLEEYVRRMEQLASFREAYLGRAPETKEITNRASSAKVTAAVEEWVSSTAGNMDGEDGRDFTRELCFKKIKELQKQLEEEWGDEE
eukprot:9473198-Pyramimonas_sp.AAC.2